MIYNVEARGMPVRVTLAEGHPGIVVGLALKVDLRRVDAVEVRDAVERLAEALAGQFAGRHVAPSIRGGWC